jgi:uncharacterized protein YehS (DUF1456 family)
MDISDPKIVEIIKLANFDTDIKSIISFLKKEEEDGYQVCSDLTLAHFLDGLIIFKRGSERESPALELPITNNLILKKLRVAFSLKEEDLMKYLS